MGLLQWQRTNGPIQNVLRGRWDSTIFRVTRSLVLYWYFVDRCLSFFPFSLHHCVVCSSSIYGFWFPLWYLQTLHLDEKRMHYFVFLSDKVVIIYLKVWEFHHVSSMSFISMLFISHNPSKSIFKYWYVLLSKDIQPSINYTLYVDMTELCLINLMRSTLY